MDEADPTFVWGIAVVLCLALNALAWESHRWRWPATLRWICALIGLASLTLPIWAKSLL
ncbi:MAG TPA: hypothetical protein VL309_07985 [Vicinamibacterales bacterium]|nr:hypothetical protein [Vicinamibacterales bacterium]